jgi:hypothetical protein
LEFVTERLKAIAESQDETWDNRIDDFSERQIQLYDILSPIYDGLQDSDNPREEFNRRIGAVKTICQEELTDLLRYIAETPKQQQLSDDRMKQPIDDSGWNDQQYATRVLEDKLEVVSGGWWGESKTHKLFTLTEKGKMVLETLESLLDSEYIEQWEEDRDSREKAAFKALSQPYPDI